MPELPEVETIVRGLQQEVIGSRIVGVIVREDMLLANRDQKKFIETIAGRVIKSVKRRGKYIIIGLSGNYSLVIHLRMTGKLLIKPSEAGFDKHSHVIFRLEGDRDLRFNNIRKFGRIYVVEGDNWQQAGSLSELGPEPLAHDFTVDKFKERISRRTTGIKSLLLKQDFIAGMGNIYTDEALYRAGISPYRSADSLTDKEITALYQAIRKVLKLGIKYNGTTFSDYVNSNGESGEFQEKLQVYQHDGEDCARCHHTIQKDKIAGRGSHFCPNCQR